jgi:MarR-like DNA-binding transcriptional regulator SgrR of sgrS sRNA
MKKFQNLKLKTILAIAMLATSGIAMASFNVQMNRFPNILEPVNVASISHHNMLKHLSRPLIAFSKTDQIQGELAESWNIQNNQTLFTFNLKKNAKFSNGDVITAEDVVGSWKRNQKSKGTIHIKFDRIKELKTISTHTFSVEFYSPYPEFLRHLNQNELRVLHKSEHEKPENKLSWKIVSGAYFLKSQTETEINFERNKYFENFVEGSPEEFTVRRENPEAMYKRLEDKNLHLIWDATNVKDANDANLVTSKSLKPFRPDLVLSLFITPNTRSKTWLKLENRKYLQKILNPLKHNFDKFNPILETSYHVYMSYGVKETSKENLYKFWTAIKNEKKPAHFPKKIKILSPMGRPENEQLIKMLTDENIAVEVELEQNIIEAGKKWDTGDYDLHFTSNDFSQIGLLSSLQATFNSKAPYVLLEPESKIPSLLKQAEETDEKSERSFLFEKIGFELLKQGNIIPNGYKPRIFFVHEDYDTSHWSTYFSDVSLWRMPKLNASSKK